MKIFEFSTNVINTIINELHQAEAFIRIANFQIHDNNLFTILNDKLNEGIRVEIFTLPYDSIHDDIRNEVENEFKNLESNGAKLYLCKWNVGDPERTSTAVGKWYLFHGKFVVTDKCAIAMSANFTKKPELDVVIIFKEEGNKIEEFNAKFDFLLDLFITENAGYDGKIRQKILETNLPNIFNVFELPQTIQTDVYRNHWVLHYPSIICPENVQIENKLYLTPFDCRGRDIYKSIILQASKYVYISTESFTDPDFLKFLKANSQRDLDIRILCGGKSMDFTDRVQNMFRDLLAHDLKIRTILPDIHAKLIITDKHVVISSINLNKINLGFKKTNQFWRENTESLIVCNELKLIKQAKIQFEKIFNRSLEIEVKLVQKLEDFVREMINSTFNLRSRSEMKSIFASLILKEQIQIRKFILDIGKTIVKLMDRFNRKMVNKNDFLMAMIIYYLSEGKDTYNQLKENISKLDKNTDFDFLINMLSDNNLIEKDENKLILKI